MAQRAANARGWAVLELRDRVLRPRKSAFASFAPVQ